MIQTLQIPSPSMRRAQDVAFIPPKVFNADGSCFTLLLLHGTGGSHMSWPDSTDILQLVEDLPILVVMPSCGDSFYMDSEVGAVETFICDELVPFFDSQFPTVKDASGRGISGLSMGGYGALLLALRRPDLFGSAASHSGAVLTSRATTEAGVKWELAEKLYGIGPEGEEKRREHDLLLLAQRFISTNSGTGKSVCSGPSLYLDCGTDDFLFYSSRELTQAFRMLHIPYEYHEYPGDHDWDFWREHLVQSLDFHMRQFKRVPRLLDRRHSELPIARVDH